MAEKIVLSLKQENPGFFRNDKITGVKKTPFK